MAISMMFIALVQNRAKQKPKKEASGTTNQNENSAALSTPIISLASAWL